MSSRMDRYYKNELVESGRSKKNKSLYKQIEDLENYTNIEGVATIEKTNEIDISKVKEMLKNRENYKKQKQLRNILEEEKEEIEVIEEEVEEVRNYDINDILSKVKKETSEPERYRSLRENQYKDLKSLSRKEKKFDIEKEEAELKELINTIVSNKELNRLKDSDDVGLLDDLKSDTVVGDASSIKKIMEEEKQKKIEENTMELDKSFYTSSLGFTQRDFEELKNINHNIKKSNKCIRILLVVLIVLFALVIAFFLLNK